MEVFNKEAMYRDFLRGVADIGDGELEFTEIKRILIMLIGKMEQAAEA